MTTRDELRAKAILKMVDIACDLIGPSARLLEIHKLMTAAFDALHGIVRVVPVEATAEMIVAVYGWQNNPGYAQSSFTAMVAVGDLTNESPK